MKIHKFEAIWFGAALVLIVGFIATVAYGAAGAGVQMVDDSGGTIDPASIGPGGEETAFDDPGVTKVSDDHYVVHVVARQFQFEPGTTSPIVVPTNAKVTFKVTSPDVTHGFSVTETNINTMVIPGQVSELSARFDEPGTYGLVCHEYCGAGHHTMGGSIEVVPQSEFDDSEVDG
jgi:cytochrome c oxidase subunit 2